MALDVSSDIDGDNDDVVDNDDNDNNEFLDCLKALTLNLNMITPTLALNIYYPFCISLVFVVLTRNDISPHSWSWG